MKRIKDRLALIYSEEDINKIWDKLEDRIEKFKQVQVNDRKSGWDEKDVVLITYADQFVEENTPALETFKKMHDKYFSSVFEVVHLLPFYPYSSDDGFSVIDYKRIDPKNGGWQDIRNLSKSTRMMFDFVCNHISAKSDWFQSYLANDSEFKNFFVEMDPSVDLSKVTRPRATPLLTEFGQEDGTKKHLWTTFSVDQIDLNYENPFVLLYMIDVLLFYLEQGAEYIRLDAVGFMWKEPGTTSIHLEKTHQLIKLFRDIVDEVAEGTVLITETNVPHKDNVSYFGNGNDEAHMVYQFPLPPLVLHSLFRADGRELTKWAQHLATSGENTSFFNFLASHDGIGLNPIRGIIPEEEIVDLAENLKEEGALVSYKKNPDGTESPYEVNVTYLDALSKKQDENTTRLKRFLTAHSILLTLPGVPAVYVQSILGSRNYYEGVERTGMNRSINRKKYQRGEIEAELSEEDTLRRIYDALSRMIKVRKNEALFHPNVAMNVLELHEKLFAFKRENQAGEELLIIHNLANEPVECPIFGTYRDLLSGKEVTFTGKTDLKPYQFVWLKSID